MTPPSGGHDPGRAEPPMRPQPNDGVRQGFELYERPFQLGMARDFWL